MTAFACLSQTGSSLDGGWMRALALTRPYQMPRAKIFPAQTGSWRCRMLSLFILQPLAMELRLLLLGCHVEPFVGHLGTLHGFVKRPPKSGRIQYRKRRYSWL